MTPRPVPEQRVPEERELEQRMPERREPEEQEPEEQDAAFLAEFTAAYRGPHDPRDALAWLHDPMSAGPTGAPSPAMLLQPLRQRLYRPRVTAGERERFDRESARVLADAEQAAAAQRTVLARRAADAAPTTEPPRNGSAQQEPARLIDRWYRRAWITVAAGAVAAGVVVLGVTGVPRSPGVPPSTAPRSASTVPHPAALTPGVVGSAPLAFVGPAAQRRSDRQDLAALFARGDRHTIGDFLYAHRTGFTGAIRTDSIAVDHRGRGPGVVSLQGIDGGGGPGNVSVLLTCSKPAVYSWTLTSDTPEGDRSRIGRSSGGNCSGALITSSFVPAHLLIPTAITIRVPDDVDYVLEVDLGQY